jgi:hypothetical protein
MRVCVTQGTRWFPSSSLTHSLTLCDGAGHTLVPLVFRAIILIREIKKEEVAGVAVKVGCKKVLAYVLETIKGLASAQPLSALRLFLQVKCRLPSSLRLVVSVCVCARALAGWRAAKRSSHLFVRTC